MRYCVREDEKSENERNGGFLDTSWRWRWRWRWRWSRWHWRWPWPWPWPLPQQQCLAAAISISEIITETSVHCRPRNNCTFYTNNTHTHTHTHRKKTFTKPIVVPLYLQEYSLPNECDFHRLNLCHPSISLVSWWGCNRVKYSLHKLDRFRVIAIFKERLICRHLFTLETPQSRVRDIPSSYHPI